MRPSLLTEAPGFVNDDAWESCNFRTSRDKQMYLFGFRRKGLKTSQLQRGMTTQRRDRTRVQNRDPHQLSTAWPSVLKDKYLVAVRRPSLRIQLIADVRAVQVDSSELVSMDDTVLETSQAGELRYSVCRCVHGPRFLSARASARNLVARHLWTTQPTFSSCQNLSTPFGAEILTSRL
jgi:hypothetical protein